MKNRHAVEPIKEHNKEDIFSYYDETESGYIVNERAKSIETVFKWIKDQVGKKTLYKMDYFLIISTNKKSDPWPIRYSWMPCFVVTGGSEGHYIHVEVIYDDGSRKLLLLGKTFGGWDAAFEFSNKLSILLS